MWGRTGIAAMVAVAALAAAGGCSTSSDDGGGGSTTPDPEQVTVKEYSDASIPEQDRIIEAFYDAHADECPNIDLRGTSREFEGRIRNQALDRPDDEPISELLLSFCDG